MTGSGTALDPYVIWDVNDLQDVGNGAPYGTGDYYELGQDIDASATVGWNGGEGFIPLCNWPVFTGSFDGKAYTISGLCINRPADLYQALFADIRGGAIVENVKLTGVSIAGDRYTAGLVGYGENCTISNCSVEGSVSGGRPSGVLAGGLWTYMLTGCSSEGVLTANARYHGGLVGDSTFGTISNCYSIATINSAVFGTQIGGLIGWSGNDDIVDSYATGDIVTNGDRYIGGFIGNLWGGDIQRCYATGNVTAGDPASDEAYGVGGFIGHSANPGTIRQCYATGDVLGHNGALGDATENGGFIGQLDDIAISDCYATGAVASHDGGGFAGTNNGSIERCYATGLVTGGGDCGGLVAGVGWNAAVDSYWDTETTGQTTSDSGTGKSTEEMKTLATFAGWDILAHSVHDPTGGYPWLSWQVPGASPIWYIYLAITPPTPPPIPNVVTLPATEIR